MKVRDTEPPTIDDYLAAHPLHDRFMYTLHEYEWLVGWYGLDVNILSAWRGPGTALFVLSDDGGPISSEDVRAFRTRLEEEWSPVGHLFTVVSVG